MAELAPITVTAQRLPMVGASAVLPGETPAQYAERRLRELEGAGEPLRVTITRGVERVPGWVWIAAGIVGALVWRASNRKYVK